MYFNYFFTSLVTMFLFVVISTAKEEIEEFRKYFARLTIF